MNKNLFKPTYLKELCQKYSLNPSKKYGQNYLTSEGVIDKIIKVADLKKTDTVVEIGPGFGVLTLALASRVKKVMAFEIERKLDEYWKKEIKDQEINGDKIEIIWGNALKELIAYSLQLTAGYKVVANIPYQITSNLLRVLLELENKPESITVMVQKEVAERICAERGVMSLLAVSVQYYGDPKIIARVNKGNFWPSPKVDSAILQIRIKSAQGGSALGGEKGKRNKRFDEEFFKVVKAGFTNKRKQLWRNLSEGLNIDRDKVKNILTEIVGNEKIRAEELGVDDWEKVVVGLDDC